MKKIIVLKLMICLLLLVGVKVHALGSGFEENNYLQGEGVVIQNGKLESIKESTLEVFFEDEDVESMKFKNGGEIRWIGDTLAISGFYVSSCCSTGCPHVGPQVYTGYSWYCKCKNKQCDAYKKYVFHSNTKNAKCPLCKKKMKCKN